MNSKMSFQTNETNMQNLWNDYHTHRYYTQDIYEILRRSCMRDLRDRTHGETNLPAMKREILELQTQLGNTFLPMMKMSSEVREYTARAKAEFRVCPHLYDQWSILRFNLDASRLIGQIQEIWNLQEEIPRDSILPFTEIDYLRAKAAHICFLIIRCNILRKEELYMRFWRLLYL